MMRLSEILSGAKELRLHLNRFRNMQELNEPLFLKRVHDKLNEEGYMFIHGSTGVVKCAVVS